MLMLVEKSLRIFSSVVINNLLLKLIVFYEEILNIYITG